MLNKISFPKLFSSPSALAPPFRKDIIYIAPCSRIPKKIRDALMISVCVYLLHGFCSLFMLPSGGNTQQKSEKSHRIRFLPLCTFLCREKNNHWSPQSIIVDAMTVMMSFLRKPDEKERKSPSRRKLSSPPEAHSYLDHEATVLGESF